MERKRRRKYDPPGINHRHEYHILQSNYNNVHRRTTTRRIIPRLPCQLHPVCDHVLFRHTKHNIHNNIPNQSSPHFGLEHLSIYNLALDFFK